MCVPGEIFFYTQKNPMLDTNRELVTTDGSDSFGQIGKTGFEKIMKVVFEK